MSGIIDAHCHFFNGEYLVDELMAAGIDALQGQYPMHDDRQPLAEPTKGLLPDLSTWKALIRYAAGVLVATADTCAENWVCEMHEYSDSALKVGALRTVPLMMDIYYIAAAECPRRGAAPSRGLALEEPGAQAQDAADSLKQEILDALVDHPAMAGLSDEQRSDRTSEIADQLDRAIAEHQAEAAGSDKDERGVVWAEHAPLRATGLTTAGLRLSPGYRKHMTDLMRLSAAHPGQVFPFLAVDPRRPGIVEFAKQQVGPKGPFFGVKVYPPLGYLPDDPELQEIYSHCLEHDLPITVHTQISSFGNPVPGGDAQAKKYANPKFWTEYLKDDKHKALRLNFGHFGGYEMLQDYVYGTNHCGDDNWTRTIVEYMTQYPNVYADVSAYAEPDAGKLVHDLFAMPDLPAEVRDRLMFGTDFVICMFHKELAGHLASYFSHYQPVSAEAKFLNDNAARFLKLG